MKMKKIFSIVLSLLMVICILPLSASASEIYPESEHNYQDNFYGEWTYKSPVPAKGLKITFSEDTWVEDSFYFGSTYAVGEASSALTVGDIVSSRYWNNGGDYIAIYDGTGELTGIYDGDSLSGKTVFVPGDEFRIILVSDSSVNGYGFKITDIKACGKNEVSEVIFHSSFPDGPVKKICCLRGGTLYLPADFRVGENLFAPRQHKLTGWSDKEGGDAVYALSSGIIPDKAEINLYASWVKISLASDEVFCFNNSSYNFVIDGEDRYIMNREDFRMLQLNLFKTYGPGPLPNPILAIVLYTYPDWDWQGSCFGISAVTALQHLGYIDILPMQNAENMNEMQPDKELISYINYYQANAATSYLTENKAVVAGNARYAQSLEYMFRSVKNGNTVILTFYLDKVFSSPGHTVLLTGAYTDVDGSHKIIIYDSNRPYSYYRGYYDTVLSISPDYKELSYNGVVLGAINWTDNFEQFKAFDIEGNTDTLSWYRAYFLQLRHYFERMFELIRNLFSFR